MKSAERYILILGATSGIARAVAKRFAAEGFNLYLAGRELDVLEREAEDLKIRYSIDAKAMVFDVLNHQEHKAFYEGLQPKPSGLVCAVGYLGDQKAAERQFEEASKIISTNFSGIVSAINIVASDFERRKEGFIIGISSVAGDRGRSSNYLYGSAKAGMTAYLSGLRGRMSRVNVQVITVKPGYVRTVMTEGLKLPELLMAEPEQVAEDIYNALEKNRHEIYTKWFWKYIMLIIKSIPERFFKRMDL